MGWKDAAIYLGVVALIVGVIFGSSLLPVSSTPNDVSMDLAQSDQSIPVSTSARESMSASQSAPGQASEWSHGAIVSPLIRLASAPAPTQPTATPVSTKPVVASPTVVAQPTRVRGAGAGPGPVITPDLLPPVTTSSVLGPNVPSSVRRWEPYITKYSSAYGLDPNLVAAIMMTESGGDPSATSRKGAVGLMQVIGGSYDPEMNVQQGAQILARYLNRFGGDVELGLAAYNAGPTIVDQYGGIPPYMETQTYIYLVLNRYYLYSPS